MQASFPPSTVTTRRGMAKRPCPLVLLLPTTLRYVSLGVLLATGVIARAAKDGGECGAENGGGGHGECTVAPLVFSCSSSMELLTPGIEEVYSEIGFELHSPICREIVIKAPRSDVWDTISQPGVQRWHPFVRMSEGIGGSDSFEERTGQPWDTMVYANGDLYSRWVRDWQDGVGYDLDVGPSRTERGDDEPPEVETRITALHFTRTEFLGTGSVEDTRTHKCKPCLITTEDSPSKV